MAEKQGLSGLADSLKKVGGDLASLEVITYTGDIKLVFKDKILNWDEIATKATTDVNMQLALATKVGIDGDATHFVTSSEIPEYVLTTHAEAVRNGSEYRTQIINFLAGKVAGLLT